MINGRKIPVKIPPVHSMCCKVSFGTRLVTPLQKEAETVVELEICKSPGLLSSAVTWFLTGCVEDGVIFQ